MDLFPVDFYTLASMDPLFPSTSRTLLALTSSSDEIDVAERLQNDVDRTTAFLMTFSIFATLWCSLSCYIYNKPHDGPGGTSLVSLIRRTIFLKWFFQQPRAPISTQKQQTKEQALDDTENNPLKTTTIDMDGANTTNPNNNPDLQTSSPPIKTNISHAQNTPQPDDSKKFLFGTENCTLVVCAIGLLILYLIWGFMQERIMGHPYGDESDESNWFKYSSFCVMLNRLFGLLISSVTLSFRGRSGNVAPPYTVSLCALSNMSSSWFQYEALHYITFPVQTIFKSSKILITMAVGKFVLKKTFPLKKYINSLVVAVGVYIFLSSQQNNKSESDKSDNDQSDLGMYFYLGLCLISGYAFCDAFTSNWQSRIFKTTKVGSLEMMQSVNAFTFVVSLCFTLTDLYDIYIFYYYHPLIIIHSLAMGLCAGFGQVLIFYTIQTFGPMKFATVMTTRMMCSVIFSILFYKHPLSKMGVIGMFVTFCALYYQAFSKGGPSNKNKR